MEPKERTFSGAYRLKSLNRAIVEDILRLLRQVCESRFAKDVKCFGLAQNQIFVKLLALT